MRADIHDGQEHKRSIHGPDTEAHDQLSPSITFGLQHTAGPYSWVRGVIVGNDVVPRMSVAPQERRLIAEDCPRR